MGVPKACEGPIEIGWHGGVPVTRGGPIGTGVSQWHVGVPVAHGGPSQWHVGVPWHVGLCHCWGCGCGIPGLGSEGVGLRYGSGVRIWHMEFRVWGPV